MQAVGPLYRIPPISGWYQWECPVCKSICEDRETVSETECHNGHQVFIAVVGTVHDGYTMIANTEKESE